MGWLTWLVIGFVLVGGYLIISSQQYDLSESGDRGNFLIQFFRWVAHLGGNLVDLTSHATKQTWLPNTTNSTQP